MNKYYNSEKNLALQTDSYKASHFLQWPKNTTRTFYYISARVGREIMLKWFGSQMWAKKNLMSVPDMAQIDEAAMIWEAHGEPFNYEGWKSINELGYLPLEIKALPEGLVVPGGIPMMTLENTTDDSGWLPGWLETLAIQQWYPTTVATKSFNEKQEVLKWLEKTGTPEDIMFKVHDFGYRACTSQEQAEIGGLAHLVNFMGTDTIAGVLAARRFYGADMSGFSIPASEHSTITSWGREGERDAYKMMLDNFAKTGKLVACVSDSYDLYNAVSNIWGKELRDQVLNSGATLVVRPDSGEPATVTLKTLQLLDEAFGSSYNDKGYKALNPAVRVIQGDGIDGVDDIRKILETITDMGYSADNVAFGQGGGLLQKCNRDTYKFAMKCSAAMVDGEWRDVFKSPIDAPWKASMKGRLDVTADTFEVVNADEYKGKSALRTIFKNGVLTVDDDFETIRNR